ncbi:FxsA family protein [Piscicoccus intestinalis]|uniref:FxsA family protein n=1 Tax=Piscicoccus intestinalis TaxID=746033 RepID=UPI0008389919|nr:FxsA family protein [Piscicoccus intestinalis]
MTRRRGRVLTLLALALLVVPLLEVLVIIQVGRAIGGWPTLALLLVESAIGAWLVRREGTRAWEALRTALTTGRMPAVELVDAALVLVGGVLLLAPGFITDIVGFFFVLPISRPITRRWLEAAVERQLLARAGIVRSDVV